ncbi:MAG: hypothetical protein QOF68_1221 [Gaiellales bacterium]|nr:hypothetical protein [Gaiellales bacterium]
MAVSMEAVRAALDPEEPDYGNAAKLGPEALPHLEALVDSGDTMLASKATYLASLIQGPGSADVVAKAAQSDDAAVRVAAAAAVTNLSASAANVVLVELVGDPDAGVRKVAQRSVPDKPNAKLNAALKAAPDAEDELGDTAPAAPEIPSTGLMPGERPDDASATMPGEQRGGGMPGEQPKMPGE